MANSIAEFFRESGVKAERIAWTTFKGHEERMRVKGLKTDCDGKGPGEDGKGCGFLPFNTRATNAYRMLRLWPIP